MANTIETSFVNQFSSNVYHLSQQKDSRVWSLFGRRETLNAEEAYFDRLGLTDAMEKVGRNADTTYVDVPYTRRRLTMRDYFWATLVDKTDKLRIIHQPESEYSKAARAAMARKMDDIGIAALLGTVYTGKTGATPVVLPLEQKLASFAAGVSSGFNLEILRQLKYKFDAAEVDDMDRHIILGAKELMDLLREEELTSQDYATVKALVNGELNQFMGFTFHRIERLPFTTAITYFDPANGQVGESGGVFTAQAAIGSKRCIAFQASAMIAGIGENLTARVSEMPNKHYSNQVYLSMSLGAMRMEEVKVIEVIVKQ